MNWSLDGGALAVAAQWCQAARDLPEAPLLMAFGTRESALVLIGAGRTLSLRRYDDGPIAAEVLWNRLEEFCRSSALMAGYIGFDAVWSDDTQRPVLDAGKLSAPTLHFWEPRGAIRIDAAPSGKVEISVLRGPDTVSGILPLPLGAFESVPLRSLDAEMRPFRESVALTIAFIQRGEGQRVTVARRIDLPDNLDLLASFAAPPKSCNLNVGRSFYLATPAIELAGHSPELLASGNPERFVCYKLSGTGARHPDPDVDTRLQDGFLADKKILNEHALSIEATRKALETVGAVRTAPMVVLDRPGLRHLMTPLTVATRPDVSWSRIMRAVLPAGAQPRAAGLETLDGLERISRGAYYGIIGVRTPDGGFEFSQVLRTLFRDRTGVYTFVGAAVTGDSTVDGESDETQLKLDDIVAMRRAQGAQSHSRIGSA